MKMNQVSYCLVVSLLLLQPILFASDRQVGCLASIKKLLCCCCCNKESKIEYERNRVVQACVRCEIRSLKDLEDVERNRIIQEERSNRRQYFVDYRIYNWMFVIVPRESPVYDEPIDLRVNSNDELDQLFQELSRSVSSDSLASFRQKRTELEKAL